MRAAGLFACALALVACDGADPTDAGPGEQDAGRPDAGGIDAGPAELEMTVVTFNSGTTEGLPHDDLPDDGYGSAQAAISDMHYGDGLAWLEAVDATTAFFAEVEPDVVVFQEIFHSPECAMIPADQHAGFVCETWMDGDVTVAQRVLGPDFQVACHIGKTDKCMAVNRNFGTVRGCDADLCLDGLDGAAVSGCGSGSRIGRGVIDLVGGGSITVVNFHGTSGITEEEALCRVSQLDLVFDDLDGAPAANGAANVVMGDFNTDPYRFAGSDPSAARLLESVGQLGEGLPFHFISEAGRRAVPTYSGLFNIDHVISDAYVGECWAPGLDERAPVYDGVYFDHTPIVCRLAGPNPP